jgi:trehalose 6-phosphate synthase/phosphatase
MAIGDDLTDEDLFRVLPEWAVSIRVGMAGTHAQHNLRSEVEVTELLQSFAHTSGVSLKGSKTSGRYSS